MPTVAETLAEAAAITRRARLAKAEPLYRSILEADPSHAEAWHFLGLLNYQTGHGDLAIESIHPGHRPRGRPRGGPSEPGPHPRGPGPARGGRGPVPARPVPPSGLRGGPRRPRRAARNQGRFAEAEDAFRQVVRLRPVQPGAIKTWVCSMARDRLDEADECFRGALP